MAKAAKAGAKAPKAKAEKVLPLCLCGCGDKVGSPRSRFRPGHDAKTHSLWLSDPNSLSKEAQAFCREKGWERGTAERGEKGKTKTKPTAKAKATRKTTTTKPEAAASAAA